MKLPFSIGEEPAAAEQVESERLLAEGHYREDGEHPLYRRRSVEQQREAIYDRAGYGAWARDGYSRLGAIGAIRQIVASAPLGQAFINIMRREVIGHTAPAPTFSNVSRKRDRDALVEVWHKWSLDPSVNGNEDLPAFLRAMVASMMTDGRVFALLRRDDDYTCGLGLLPVTRDWLADDDNGTATAYYGSGGPERMEGVAGVIRSASGRISHYVFRGVPTPERIVKHRNVIGTGSGVFPSVPVGGYGQYIVPADLVLDLYSTRNAAELSGTPSHLLPALDKLKELAALDTAVVAGMQTAAYKMGFLKKMIGAPALTAQRAKDEKNYVRPPSKLQKHRLVPLPEGWDVQMFEPSQPNPAMSEYRKELIMNAAASLGIDNATLAGDLRQVNFSSSRQGVLAARDTYRVVQREVERRVLRPALARLIETAQMRGELKISSKSAMAATMTDFRHRGWAWTDPVKDINASLLAVQLGVDSPQRIAAQMGVDYDQIIADLAEAKEKMEKAGLVFPQAVAPMADVEGSEEQEKQEKDDEDDAPAGKEGDS